VVVSGTFDSTTTLGNYTLTSNGGTDALLFKITDNSIYRGNIKKGPYCAGDSIEVPYRAYGKYADTNTFFAELSDENGNFYGMPRQLGSLRTNALQGTIRGVLPLFDVVSSGKYRIRIRSNSPFVQSFMRYDSLYLLIYSKDKANPGADTTICVGEALQLKTTGGTRWHWSPGTAVTDSTARVTQFVGKQNTRLRIAISDSSGCGAPDTAWKYIALYPKLAVTARDTVVCRNTSFHITATVEGGRPSSRGVQWYAGTTYLGKDTLKSSTWFDTSFMAVATDGCASNTDTTRVRVSLPNPPSLNINDTTVCAGSLLLWQPTITGYKGRPVQLSWYRGTTKLSDSLLQLQVDSNQVLWLYGDDYCAAAENRKEVHIEVFEKPTVSVVIDSICAEVGHTVMFAAAGGKGPYTYWLNDQQVSKSAYALVQPSQWLRWYAQDACQQMTVLDSMLVHQQPRGQIMAAPENGCAPLMVSLRSNQTNTTWYIENNSIQGQDTLPYGFTKAGVYTVKMVVENGECKDSVSKQIEVYEAPKAWFEIQQRDLLIGEARTRVINTSGPAKRYIWYWKDSMRESSSLDAWALHLQDTGMSKVWMIAENIRGCRDTFTDTVYVHPQPILWIPTAITLNGDGLNDALAAGGIGLKSYRFMVFNRWGEMVFSGKENEEWRPSSTVLPGMYVYRCIYSNWKGTKFEQNGAVMLLR
jgi:PKD repeat protein